VAQLSSEEPRRQTLTPAEAHDLIRQRDYDALRGCRESSQLDFKAGWYRLEDDHEKAELAKDVSAMANSGGGYIIRGVATERLSSAEEEIVSSVKPIPADEVDREQHRSVVKAWCFPQVRGVEFHWHRAADAGAEGERGVFVIEVRSRRLPPSGAAAEIAPAEIGAESDVDALLDKMEQYMGWTDGAGYYVVALPTRFRGEVPEDFYASDGVYGDLSKPPSLRWAGFGLSYDDEPERVGADLVVSSARERCLWLRRNGLFAAGMNAKGEFLSWGYTTRLDEPTQGCDQPISAGRIHAPVHTIRQRQAHTSIRWHVGLQRRDQGRAGASVAFGIGGSRFPLVAREPTGDQMKQRLHGARSPPRDAYRIVASVYDFFGADRSAIPFVSDYAIDPQKLIAEAGGDPG
jgi:hypothetical protein